jgi:hypothetical protein
MVICHGLTLPHSNTFVKSKLKLFPNLLLYYHNLQKVGIQLMQPVIKINQAPNLRDCTLPLPYGFLDYLPNTFPEPPRTSPETRLGSLGSLPAYLSTVPSSYYTLGSTSTTTTYRTSDSPLYSALIPSTLTSTVDNSSPLYQYPRHLMSHEAQLGVGMLGKGSVPNLP